MGDDPVAWRYGSPRPRPFCGELPSATLRGRGLDPGIPKLGKSSCARALSLLSFCPRSVSREKLAYLRATSRNAACTAVSRALRNRDRSCLLNGAGPRVISPSSRRCRAISRPASAFPIFASVHCFPVGETTRPPFLRQRDASGMSEVTHTSVAPMRSAMQSAAASALSPTRIMLTFDVSGGRIGREPLETTRTLSPRRAATR
jgi:hypothetical protein